MRPGAAAQELWSVSAHPTLCRARRRRPARAADGSGPGVAVPRCARGPGRFASSPAARALLAAGETALAAGAWESARDSFEAALAQEMTPDGLDGLARALWWLDRQSAAIDARVRAYALFRRAGEIARAARIAVWLAHEYSAVHGNEPAAEGWLARAEHVLAGHVDAPERGYLDLARAERCLDPAVAAGHAEAALLLARRLDDPDLEIAALSRLGLVMITLGQVDEGLAHLDQAMAAATGEEAATFEAVAQTCCSLVMACDLAGDDDRLRQWGKVVEGYVHRHNELRLLAFCPTCEADLLEVRRSGRRVRGRPGARPCRACRHGPTFAVRRSRRPVVAAPALAGPGRGRRGRAHRVRGVPDGRPCRRRHPTRSR